MRPSLRLVIAAALMGVWSGGAVSLAAGPDQPDVDALLQHLDDLYRSKSSIARIQIDVTSPRSARSMRLRAWTRGEEEVLVLIEAPPREAGTATLRVGNNLWNYLPKIARTIRVPPAAMLGSWMGTDFTNDDLVKESSLQKDFTARIDRRSDAPPMNWTGSTMRMAWRNLWRNPRRTALALAAIGLSVTLVLAYTSILRAYDQWIVETITGPMLGHVQAHAPQWRKDRLMERTLRHVDATLAELRRDPDVASATARVYAPALAAREEEGFAVMGIDSGAESGPARLLTDVVEPLQEREALIGRQLAELMNVRVGDEVAVVGQGVDGSVANGISAIVGFFSQILASQSLPRSTDLAAVGSGCSVLGAVRDNFGDSLGVAVVLLAPVRRSVRPRFRVDADADQ